MRPRQIVITTLTTAARAPGGACDDGRTCPGVHVVADRPHLYYVVVTEVVDPMELAAFAAHIGPGEKLGTTPRHVIDDVHP